MKLHANVCSQWEWTKLRQLLVIVLLGLGIVSTYGQTKTVSGIVKSESGGEPLVGATVKVKETNTGGITDIDGRYTIQANLGQTLIVSYIGYRTKEVKVERTTRIDILLQEDNEMLDEVVVVGYGTMKRSDLTGSVVSVTGDELKKSVVTSLDQALQGRAAGVQVTQNSGTPGGGISVSIRGINSLNGNEPLYVIDGVAISGNNTSNSSVLSSINPADIVSMEVLKDASATAIYGSRASNGVVLITTRQGEEGKTKVSYEGYYALQQLPKKLETLTLPEYAVYQNLRAATIGFGAREEFKDPSLLSRGTDWQNEIFRTAPMHNHQINISGGSKSMKYSLSGGYMQQDGIVFGSDFERFSFRVNMDNDINKWLTTGLRASVARTQQTNNVDGSGAIYNALNQLPEVPARNPDGSFGMQTENMYGTYFSNPLSDLIQNENYSRNTQVYVNAFADIKLWKGLVFRTEYAANFNYSNDYKFTPSYDYEHFKQQSSASRGAGNGSNWTLKTYFTYNNTFGKHGLSAMLGHEAQENKYESLSGSRTNFLFNSVHELDAGDATTAKANSSRGSSAIESYFGRLNYNYDDRYLLTATLRADGSSSFAKESRWGWFPSVALAWKVNNEAFLKDVEAINSLKLRLGWGVVGNQWAGSYAYGVTMASAASIWGTGFYAGNYPNRELKWEETNSFNVGLDLARSGWKGGTRDNADLEKAKELAADVINNSGISLYENYEDLFKYKHNNNPESLIAMQWVPLGDWGVCNTLLADLAGNSKMTGGVNVWSSYQASIDMLQQYELGDTIRRNATFCTPGTYYSYICIADGGYTYDGATSCIKKGVPGGPDDDNDGYIQSMNSPLNTYILRLADVYLTYAEACLGNSEELAGGPGLEALNQVRDRARIPRKERVTFEDIIRERRVEFSMEYCNWYDMVSWYHWKPDYMLNYFQNQHRGYTVDLIVKDEDGYLHFGKKEGDTFLEGIENWQEPGENIEIHHGNILMPYPESDVIQNPLLNEEPVAYEFSE